MFSVRFVLSCPASQIRGVPLWCVSGCQLGALLCSGRSVDAERAAGGRAGDRGYRSSEARVNRLLPAAGRERPVSGQRGTRPVDGHGAVEAAARSTSKREELGAGCATPQGAVVDR